MFPSIDFGTFGKRQKHGAEAQSVYGNPSLDKSPG
jgi:hypothetical protein